MATAENTFIENVKQAPYTMQEHIHKIILVKTLKQPTPSLQAKHAWWFGDSETSQPPKNMTNNLHFVFQTWIVSWCHSNIFKQHKQKT